MSADGETELLLPSSPNHRQTRFAASSFLAVFGIVAGTYYWYALLAAFEKDPGLHWTARTTTLACTSIVITEKLGYVVLGPLSDYIHAGMLLAFNGVVLCSLMACEIMCQRALAILIVINVVSFVSGLMWPAVCSLTAVGLKQGGRDQSFLLTALGSRAADTATPLFLGALMWRFDMSWRAATAVLLLCISTVLALALGIFPYGVVKSADNRDKLSVTDVREKWQRLLVSWDAWLNWLILVTSGIIWSLSAYTSVLLVDLYDIPGGQAASAAAVIPAGMMCGLVCATLISSVLGVTNGRLAQLLQVVAGVVALGILAARPRIGLSSTLGLLLVGGAGAVVPCYLPSLVFAADAEAPERAFRLSALWASTAPFGVAMTYLLGVCQESTPSVEVLASCLYGVTAVGWQRHPSSAAVHLANQTRLRYRQGLRRWRGAHECGPMSATYWPVYTCVHRKHMQLSVREG